VRRTVRIGPRPGRIQQECAAPASTVCRRGSRSGRRRSGRAWPRASPSRRRRSGRSPKHRRRSADRPPGRPPPGRRQVRLRGRRAWRPAAAPTAPRPGVRTPVPAGGTARRARPQPPRSPEIPPAPPGSANSRPRGSRVVAGRPPQQPRRSGARSAQRIAIPRRRRPSAPRSGTTRADSAREGAARAPPPRRSLQRPSPRWRAPHSSSDGRADSAVAVPSHDSSGGRWRWRPPLTNPHDPGARVRARPFGLASAMPALCGSGWRMGQAGTM
jgi:hypothetical protein